jgi:light-regulated signal transduction histidine kinase (bacteriophytochrome)
MMDISHQQMNSVRTALEEESRGVTARDGDRRTPWRDRSGALYDEITQLNNELVAMQRDLAKKNAELERLNEKAQREIAKRRQAQEALARSNSELERFASVISHDLREPARTVEGYLRLLEDRYADQLDPGAREYVNYAVDGARRMQHMITALLDLSRVETRGKDLAPTEVEAVLAAALKGLGRAIEDTHGEVTHDPLPTIMADEAQLSQVFQNLITNAFKFRKEDEPPRVHVSAERVGDEWVFSVTDNGIGIDLHQADRVFQVFQRLHTEEEYPGLGIGLALSKRIVERHGGRIWVESELEEGSTFYFTLPAGERVSADG